MALKPTNKILICHLFWDGDREQSKKMCRLIADLEPEHSVNADFLFVPRFDSTVDEDTVSYVSRKFNVHTYTSKKRGTGWPAGCNSIFFGAMEWVYHKMSAGQIPHYKAIIILGADVVPLQKGWIEKMMTSWIIMNKRKKFCVAGALIPAGEHGHAHINGDCIMLSGDLKFLKWLAVTVNDIQVRGGWDWLLASDFQKWGWFGMAFIRSIWRKERFSESEWDAEIALGTVMYHGVKNDDLLDLSREKLL